MQLRISYANNWKYGTYVGRERPKNYTHARSLLCFAILDKLAHILKGYFTGTRETKLFWVDLPAPEQLYGCPIVKELSLTNKVWVQLLQWHHNVHDGVYNHNWCDKADLERPGNDITWFVLSF